MLAGGGGRRRRTVHEPERALEPLEGRQRAPDAVVHGLPRNPLLLGDLAEGQVLAVVPEQQPPLRRGQERAVRIDESVGAISVGERSIHTAANL